MRTTLSTLSALLLLVSPVASASPLVSSCTITRGTLTLTSDAIVFKSAKQEDRFPVKRIGDLIIPGCRAVHFTEREIGSPTSGTTQPASILTLECEDGSKLALTVNQPVQVLRIQLIFSDETKATLWKLASDIL